MAEIKKDITVTVFTSSKKYVLKTYRGEYRNLMMLIYDKCLEEIGECRGRGLCGTCHIHVLEPADFSGDVYGLEEDTLCRLYRNQKNSRLSCQIMIDGAIDGMVVRLLGDSEENTY